MSSVAECHFSNLSLRGGGRRGAQIPYYTDENLSLWTMRWHHRRPRCQGLGSGGGGSSSHRREYFGWKYFVLKWLYCDITVSMPACDKDYIWKSFSLTNYIFGALENVSICKLLSFKKDILKTLLLKFTVCPKKFRHFL